MSLIVEAECSALSPRHTHREMYTHTHTHRERCTHIHREMCTHREMYTHTQGKLHPHREMYTQTHTQAQDRLDGKGDGEQAAQSPVGKKLYIPPYFNLKAFLVLGMKNNSLLHTLGYKTTSL